MGSESVKTTSLKKNILQPQELENAFKSPFLINSTLSCKWSSTVRRSSTHSCCCSPQGTGHSQECYTVYEKQCQTVYRNECVEQFKTEYEPYTETECSTEYKEDCEYQWEGHGNDKVWAPIAGTCKSNPYETCSDVTKSKAVQVPSPVCRDIPEQKCVDVPRQQCVQIPDQVCINQPLQKCQDVPRQACQQIHKKVPNRVSRKVPKKVCQDSGSHLDEVAGGSRPDLVF